jgi:hypothetical protein
MLHYFLKGDKVKKLKHIFSQYYPPKGFNMFKTNRVFNPYINHEHFALTIIELGALGYLTFKENKKSITLNRTLLSDEYLTREEQYLLNDVLFFKKKNGSFLKRITMYWNMVLMTLLMIYVTSGFLKKGIFKEILHSFISHLSNCF